MEASKLCPTCETVKAAKFFYVTKLPNGDRKMSSSCKVCDRVRRRTNQFTREEAINKLFDELNSDPEFHDLIMAIEGDK